MILLTTTIEFTTLLILLFLLVDFFTGFKMIKSLFNRLRMKADNAAEAIRDPEADAHAALAKLEENLHEMEELRKEILKNKKKAEIKQSQAEAEITRYEELAILAGKSNNVDKIAHVKLALANKALAQQRFTDATAEVLKRTQQEDKTEQQIISAKERLARGKEDKDYLVTERKINLFDVKVNKVLGEGGDVDSDLNRLRADVEDSRIDAEVASEGSTGLNLDTLYKPANAVSMEYVNKYLTA